MKMVQQFQGMATLEKGREWRNDTDGSLTSFSLNNRKLFKKQNSKSSNNNNSNIYLMLLGDR